jgi:AraC-like DNA-binding protein
MSEPLDAIAVSGLLVARLAAVGVDPARVLERAGLPRDRVVSGGTLTTREFFALWHAVDAEPGPRDLGLRLSEGRRPSEYDVASAAALRSPNLEEAVRRFARYKRLSCPEQVRVDVKRGEASIRFHWVLAETHVPRTLVDASFASLLALARRGTGTALTPLRLELARRPADEALLARHFGCPIRFEAPFDRFVLPEKALSLPFITFDPAALADLVPGLDAALERRAGRATFDDDVRMAIVRAMCGERPSIDRVARELGVGTRTLQRRLGQAGLTYQSLLDEVRRTAARRLLAKTSLETTDVAFLLGFEEPNSFHRSFTAWEGLTPGRWRGRALERGAART